MDISQINMWAVLWAGVAKFIIGGLWYSPFLFGGLWLRETGQKKENMGSPVKPVILAAGLGLITAFTLAVILHLAQLDFVGGMALGGLIATGIMAAMLGPQFIFEGRSFRLYMIYTGQYMTEIILMTAIIGALQ